MLKAEIYKNIIKIAKKQGISPTQIEKDLNLSHGSIYNIQHHSPQIERIVKIADYLKVSLDKIVRGG